MEEEDINLWYEEKKEEIVKNYFKKMDSLLISSTKEEDKKDQKQMQNLTTEQRKELMLNYEKNFIESTSVIKKKYESLISKLRKQERKKIFKDQKKGDKIGFTAKILQSIREFFRVFSKGLGKDIKQFKEVSFDISSGIKRNEQLFSFFVKDRFHPEKMFYIQHIWPILHYLNTPNRIMKIRLLKLKDKVKEKIKKAFATLKDRLNKLIKGTLAKLKVLIEKLKKLIEKIIATVKKIIGYLRKVVKVIQSKLPKKKDAPDDKKDKK